MATYKVIQDIEAEDKLVGPLTLKQFIYAGVAAFCLYICFLGITKHFPFVIAIFLPVALVAGFFAFPFGRDQPTETWALAKIRFLFKPRRRIWDQSGVKELVTITAPKKVHEDYTNGLSQGEVKSRLRALADTLDSRGWAVKNVNVNLFSQPSQLMAEQGSDRLIDLSNLPQDVPTVDVSAADDVLDDTSQVAQQFQQMISASDQAHRQQVVQNLKAVAAGQQPVSETPNDYWFMNQPSSAQPVTPGYATFQRTQVVTPGSEDEEAESAPTAEEQALAQRLHDQQQEQPNLSQSHLRKILPLSQQPVPPGAGQRQPGTVPAPFTPAAPAVTPLPESVKMRLASNDDRNVASLAREAHEAARHTSQSGDEVVVSLH